MFLSYHTVRILGGSIESSAPMIAISFSDSEVEEMFVQGLESYEIGDILVQRGFSKEEAMGVLIAVFEKITGFRAEVAEFTAKIINSRTNDLRFVELEQQLTKHEYNKALLAAQLIKDSKALSIFWALFLLS
ncbi:MAG: hypothetical protein HY007_01820 [Candidatus Sungbacteria bacterium]|nr:hypothetical protein [Candidatus Sungbacteria bacterium]